MRTLAEFLEGGFSNIHLIASQIYLLFSEGARFDLPIALGLLAASGQIDTDLLAHLECAGELGLSGELRPVKGALAMALALRAAKLQRELILPRGCTEEAALVQGLVVREAAHLIDLVHALQPRSDQPLPRIQRDPPPTCDTTLDLRDIKGQSGPKRALEIAATGGLSLLLVGPPGTGKSMLAQRLPGLLPPCPRQRRWNPPRCSARMGSSGRRCGHDGPSARRITAPRRRP